MAVINQEQAKGEQLPEDTWEGTRQAGSEGSLNLEEVAGPECVSLFVRPNFEGSAVAAVVWGG